MVVQRVIENLKLRSKDERRAFAKSTAIVIVIILFFGWAFFFFRNLSLGPLSDTQQAFSAAANAAQEIQVSVPLKNR